MFEYLKKNTFTHYRQNLKTVKNVTDRPAVHTKTGATHVMFD